MIGLAAFLIAAAAPVQGGASDPLAVEAMHNFGACVVQHTPSGARELLATNFRTEEYREKLRRFARGHGRCAPRSELRFNGLLFAGAIAETLLETEIKPSDLTHALARNPEGPAIKARDAVETMALCTVLVAPGETTALLRTVPGSMEEGPAAIALAPTLASCLSKESKVELNRPAVRSILALAAWRIATSNLRTTD